MREKLPVKIESFSLPKDNYQWLDTNKKNSYGYVKTMYLLSLLITLASILMVIFLGA